MPASIHSFVQHDRHWPAALLESSPCGVRSCNTLQGGEGGSGSLSKFMRTGEAEGGTRTPPEVTPAEKVVITDPDAAEADKGIFGDWSDDDAQI